MQFQVPQFIETEDKIVGPLTLKQFGYVGTAGIISIFSFLVLSTPLWLAITSVLLGISASLAFLKVNGRPLSVFLRALFDSIWSPRTYNFRPRRDEPKEFAIKSVPSKNPFGFFRKLALGKKKSKQALKIQEIPPKPQITITPRAKETQIQTYNGIRGLRERLATSKNAIPQRERALPGDFGVSLKKFKERYEVVRHLSGNQEIAERIDYR